MWMSDFRESARHFKNVRALAYGAVLLALQVAVAIQLHVPLGDFMRITFDRCVLALSASILGPAVGLFSGAAADLIKCLFLGYAVNPGLTLNAALAGFVYGAFLYRRPAPLFPMKGQAARGVLFSFWPLLLSQAIVTVGVNIVLGTLWLSIMNGAPYFSMLPARALKNLVQYPVDVLIICGLLTLRDRMFRSGAIHPFASRM